MGFIKELGYPGGITTWDEASQNHSKRLIKTHFLVDTRSNEERKVIFGEFRMHLDSLS